MNQPAPIPLPRDARLQRYADGILEGLEGWQAYKAAFPDCRTKPSAATGHKRTSKRPDVKAYIRAVRQARAEEMILSLRTKREFLFRIVTTPLTSIDLDSPTRKDHDLLKKFKRTATEFGESVDIEKLDALKAIDLDNKLSGDDAGDNAMHSLAAAIAGLGSLGPVPQGEDRM
jgi:hypothetical protein